MAADGQLDGAASASPKRLTIPRGVSEFIKRLTQPLPEETRDILDIASVIGREFAVNAIEAASQTSREQLIELLDHVVALDLINEVPGAIGRYSFRHALIREALYDALPPAKRRRLHRVVAEAIRSLRRRRAICRDRLSRLSGRVARRRGSSDRLLEAGRAHRRKAARLRGSGASSAQRGRRACAQARRNDSLRGELLCELGEAQGKTGDLSVARETCLTAADIARRVDRPELFARAVVAAGRGLSNSGVTDRSLVLLLSEAEQMLGESDSPSRAGARPTRTRIVLVGA